MARDDRPGRHDGTEIKCVMVPICVLLANEPRAYRDTLAVALPLLRPHVEVIVVDPESIDEAVVQHTPHIVICSRHTTAVETQVPSWILLQTEAKGAMNALSSVVGERTAIHEIDLDELVRVIDQTEQFVQSSSG